jgi:hypothetical protein
LHAYVEIQPNGLVYRQWRGSVDATSEIAELFPNSQETVTDFAEIIHQLADFGCVDFLRPSPIPTPFRAEQCLLPIRLGAKPKAVDV